MQNFTDLPQMDAYASLMLSNIFFAKKLEFEKQSSSILTLGNV